MRKKLLIEIGLVIVWIVAGVAVYFAVAPKTVVNLAPMARLSFTDPQIAHITPKATYSAPTTPQSSGLAVLEQSYAIAPGETGAYTAQWFGLGTNGGNVGLFVELLPTAKLATTAAQDQIDTNMTPTVLKAQKYTLKSTFAIPNLPGSSAVSFLIPIPAKKSASGAEVAQPPEPGYTAEIQVGRAATRINFTGTAATKAGLVKIAQREAATMKSGLAGLQNMASTAYPVGPGLLVLLGVVVLSALVFFVPMARGRYLAAQLAREQARRRYQLQSRGAKVARRKGGARR
jgi:hypothetical protein